MAVGLSSNSDNLTTRQTVAPATGPAPDSSPPTGNVPLANVSNADDLKAIEALAGTAGLLAKTAANTWALRTLTGTANQVLVSNGDGVSGNPTLTTPQDIATTSAPQFARLGLGTAADANNLLTIIAQAAPNRNSGWRYYADDANGQIMSLRKGRGTLASPTAVQSGDVMCDLNLEGIFSVAGVANDKPGARIRALAGATWTAANTCDTVLAFHTIITGGTTAAERMRISIAGNFLIGGTADTGLTGAGGLRVFSTTEATNAAGSGIFDGGVLVKKALFVNATTATSSGTTGALVCAGGVGVAGKVFVADTTDASSTATGAIITSGGVGVAKKLYTGDTTEATATNAASVVLAGGLGVAKGAFFGGPIGGKAYTVAGLPAASAWTYCFASVTDATLTAITGLGLAPTGGGANKVPVWSDGTNWLML